MYQQTRDLNFNLNHVRFCPCCQKVMGNLEITEKVNITPDGANNPIPPVGTVEITDSALTLAIAAFDRMYPYYEDLLYARVENMSTTDVLETIEQGDWVWNQDTKTYRNVETGERISERKLIEIRDILVELWRTEVQVFAEMLATGEINIQEWTLTMRREVQNIFGNEFMLAVGGYNTMNTANILVLADMVSQQYGYLQSFAEVIRQGNLSKNQIAARSELYMNSATQSFEKGMGRRFNIDLPAHPADGSQICLSNCKCHWHIVEDDEKVEAYWKLDPAAEHCETCIGNSREWNPYVVMK